MAVQTISKPSGATVSARQWPPLQGEWTYDDYTQLPDNGMRYEVIKGELYMSPAPSPKHQQIILKLAIAMSQFVHADQLGEIYQSPIDVKTSDFAGVVQPDLLFIASKQLDIVQETLIEGVPDLIVEVLSPGNPLHDRRIKFELYAQAGVREYWLIDPDARTVEIYVLRGQAYAPLGNFGIGQQTRSEVLEGFVVDVEKICPA